MKLYKQSLVFTGKLQIQMLRCRDSIETYFRLLMTNAYVALQKRLTSFISATVEGQYTTFTRMYPDIVQRVPQHMIASYKGLTPETLSRVRKKMASK
jgi:hypothetical protein